MGDSRVKGERRRQGGEQRVVTKSPRERAGSLPGSLWLPGKKQQHVGHMGEKQEDPGPPPAPTISLGGKKGAKRRRRKAPQVLSQSRDPQQMGFLGNSTMGLAEHHPLQQVFVELGTRRCQLNRAARRARGTKARSFWGTRLF